MKIYFKRKLWKSLFENIKQKNEEIEKYQNDVVYK